MSSLVHSSRKDLPKRLSSLIGVNWSSRGRSTRDECSFNAGLMVYDLDMYRQEDYASKLLEWVEINNEHNLYHLGSQPPVNLVFYRNYKVLDSRFNRMNLAALRQPGPYGKQPYTVPPEELRQAVVVQ